MLIKYEPEINKMKCDLMAKITKTLVKIVKN